MHHCPEMLGLLQPLPIENDVHGDISSRLERIVDDKP